MIQDMDPVADITYNVVNKQRARLDASDIFREAGYKVDRQGFGIIEIGENQLSDSTRYLNTPAEFAAWMCVPKVLKRGRVISGHENHKDRGYTTITIAAPVVINGKRGDVAVVVQQKGKNKYHVHRILMPDGSRFEYENTKNAESTGDRIVGKKANKRLSIDSASNDSITQPDGSVNTSSKNSPENIYDTENGVMIDDSTGAAMFSIDETPETPDVSENATDTNDGGTEEELTDRDMLLAMAERLVGNEKENEILTRYKEQHEAQLRREDKPDSIYDEVDEQRGILYTDPDAAKRSAAFTTNWLRQRTIGCIFCEKVKKIFPFSENNIPKPIDKSAAMVYNDANEMHGGFRKRNDR